LWQPRDLGMNDSSNDGRSAPPARRPATRVVTAGGDPKFYHGFMPYRTTTRWQPGGPTVRFHTGLESVEDLTADLERGFATLAAAARS